MFMWIYKIHVISISYIISHKTTIRNFMIVDWDDILYYALAILCSLEQYVVIKKFYEQNILI